MASTAKAQPTFLVDKRGLAKLLERKGKEFAVTELIQNAWDEETTTVGVSLESVGHGKAKLVVEDDNPEGFADLTHAYTLFAESAKKDDVTKRGRFNLGEKLVIALCDTASIETTKGTVVFTDKGRVHTAKKRQTGSRFTGVIRMTKDEIKRVEEVVHTLIPPHGIETTFNFVAIPARTAKTSFEVSLRTERADADGVLKPTTRKTTVEVHEPRPGEVASLYEMGIPVVETGDRWHVNIAQKVPLTTDRDNVPPAYLRDVRTAVLNSLHGKLSADDAKAAWVTNAMEDESVTPEAVAAVIKGRFGEKAVVSDPTDPEANKIAAEAGYTVIPGGAFSKAAWGNVKGHGTVQPAGAVTPSPQPYDDAPELKLMNPEHYPKDVSRVLQFAHALAEELLGAHVEHRVANAPQWPYSATYGPKAGGTEGMLTLNLGRLGFKWFRPENAQAQLDLLIHEYGHHYCSDHLDRKYLKALTRLGAQATMLALTKPDFYNVLTGEEAVA